ncbi:MAG TPA: type II toxin-antitoxin system HipA family toxin [Opitutaceae bacterium]|jgi:serine/threonine-protein kinase HipA|nr:type II toxin-antitoxin system HipA family toxin [Opitutaceae bacterium]
MNTKTTVEMRAWGHPVGVVGIDPDRAGAYIFEYFPAWSRQGIELAPLQMPTRTAATRRVVWSFPQIGRGFKGLPGLVADALPDAFGNRLIDAYLARKGLTAGQVTAIDRLAYMAKRGMGALEFHPAIGSRKDLAGMLDMSALVEEARQVVTGQIGSPSEATESLQEIIKVGTSAGGARPKAVIAWNPATSEVRSGQFDVPEGFEHWLLKFDGVGHAGADLGTPAGYGRIEYGYYLMATAAGIRMSQCRLLEENGRAHFMTRRFDRDGNRKHHVQSLCALQHLDYMEPRSHAYEQLFSTIRAMGLGEAARTEAFRRMAFNFVASNHDDHTKNFAFMMKEGGDWQLAPAYDVTYAYRPESEWVSAHQMSVNGKFANAGREDFLALADTFAVPGARDIIEEVWAAALRWPEFAAKAGVPEGDAARLMGTFRGP